MPVSTGRQQHQQYYKGNYMLHIVTSISGQIYSFHAFFATFVFNMGKQIKTNAARLLDRAGISYELVSYPVTPDDLGAQHIADQLGEDINRVFKTLVLHGDRAGEYFVAVVPGNTEVDLKKAARAAGFKKVDLIPMKELLPLTGYIRGGCSPIGMKKRFPTFFHATASEFDKIYVSAGCRGLQLYINPQQLINYIGASVTDLIKNDTDE